MKNTSPRASLTNGAYSAILKVLKEREAKDETNGGFMYAREVGALLPQYSNVGTALGSMAKGETWPIVAVQEGPPGSKNVLYAYDPPVKRAAPTPAAEPVNAPVVKNHTAQQAAQVALRALVQGWNHGTKDLIDLAFGVQS